MRTIAAVGAVLGLVAMLGAQVPLVVEGLPDGAPLAITAEATADSLVVVMKLQPEWHVYARDVGGGQPVELTLAADCGFRATAPLRLPADHDGQLTGNVRIELPIAVQPGGEGLRATLQLQVCDALECLAPMSIDVTGQRIVGQGLVGQALVGQGLGAEPPAFPVLLVVDEVDERSGRIEAFLGDRGFEVEVTTYAQVTAEQCERHAVVLADSKLFGKTAKVREQVLKFPQGKTPIVAVGFFGTELIEAHGIAMTSGYI